jgi:hypothetical protein
MVCTPQCCKRHKLHLPAPSGTWLCWLARKKLSHTLPARALLLGTPWASQRLTRPIYFAGNVALHRLRPWCVCSFNLGLHSPQSQGWCLLKPAPVALGHRLEQSIMPSACVAAMQQSTRNWPLWCTCGCASGESLVEIMSEAVHVISLAF